MSDRNPTCGACEARTGVCSQVVKLLKQKEYPEEGMRFDQRFKLDLPDGTRIVIGVELVVWLQGRPALLVKCVTGNLVTRERASLAVARLYFEPPPPRVVVAGAADAVVFDTKSGKSTGFGFAALPASREVVELLRTDVPLCLSPEQREREKKILTAYLHLGCSAPEESF